MNEMIERVARAIESTGPREAVAAIEPSWLAFVPQARAAIEAMREPNEQMLKVAWNYAGHPDKEFVLDGGMWREMIDAALK